MDIVTEHSSTLENVPVNQGSVPANNDGDDDMDRISNLPTDILCYILSFLPTKHAVATSILSTKWQNLLPLIPNLKIRLDDTQLMHRGSTSDSSVVHFKDFVDRTLTVTLCSMPWMPSLYCFDLVCLKCNDGQEIGRWINAALHLNVKHMFLQIRRITNAKFLLDSLFGCNLTSLVLMLDFANDAFELRFSLPKLKVLKVKNMESDVINALLQCCPLLECLMLNYCYCHHGALLRISFPFLRFLTVFNGPYPIVADFELDAPRLQFLHYRGFLPSCLLAEKLKFLHGTRLELVENFDEYAEDLEQWGVLIKACSNVEKLWVTGKVIRMFHYLPRPLPRFQRLVILQISRMDSYGWDLLPSLLDSAPNFKKLYLESGFENENYERFNASLKKPWSVCLAQWGERGFVLRFSRETEN